jgi:hypothetical protein
MPLTPEEMNLLNQQNIARAQRRTSPEPITLKVVGDVVQTSKKYEAPVSQAKELLDRVRGVIASGRAWRRINEGDFMGPKIAGYRVDEIRTDGSVRIACHDIPSSSIQAIAKELDAWRPASATPPPWENPQIKALGTPQEGVKPAFASRVTDVKTPDSGVQFGAMEPGTLFYVEGAIHLRVIGGAVHLDAARFVTLGQFILYRVLPPGSSIRLTGA